MKAKEETEYFEKNKRLILDEKYRNTRRWNPNVNSRQMLIGSYKLDKQQLFRPEKSLKTLKQAVTERNLHKGEKFRNTKVEGEYFRMERTHIQ